MKLVIEPGKEPYYEWIGKMLELCYDGEMYDEQEINYSLIKTIYPYQHLTYQFRYC